MHHFLRSSKHFGLFMVPRKITIVISSLNAGGAERVVTMQANYLARDGHVVTIITMNSEYTKPFFDLDKKVRHVNVDFGPPTHGLLDAIIRNSSRCIRLRKAIAASTPDCIISHLHVVNIRTLISSIGLNVPVIVVEHGLPNATKLNTAFLVMRNLTYRKSSTLVVPSSGMIELFPAKILRKCKVIPNQAVVPNHVGSNELNPLPAGKNIVAIGRLVKIKRFGLLLDAFSKISMRNSTTLHIVGDGPLKESLVGQACALGISDRVMFWGSVNDPWRIFRDADLLVLTSNSEAFSMVVLESMAHGVPVASFDCPVGPREIIRDGIDGVLVNNGDIDAMASSIDALISNDEKRKKMASRAVEVTERFSENRIMTLWTQCIGDSIAFDEVNS